MTRSQGRTLGAVAAGLVAGAAITALMVAGERQEGEPSELAVLGRESLTRLGLGDRRPSGLLSLPEQAAVQGGHLVLSALGGLAYAAAFDEDAPVAAGGLAFGAAFYLAAHAVAGPALRVKAPEWRQDRATVAKHLVVHAAYGLLVALGARLGSSLPRKPSA